MIDFISYILEQSAWLYTKIYQTSLFFFDLWSIVHLLSGFAIYLVLRALRLKHPLIILLSILLAYEVVEILFVYFAFMIFHPETIKDQFTDIFIGLCGALVGKVYLKNSSGYREKHPLYFNLFMMFVASFTYAFFWVGFYHYHYNVESYNSPGINWSTVTGWTAGGLFVLTLFRFLPVKNIVMKSGITWIIYFGALLLFEYIYYYILEVRETSGLPLKPLVFGLVHGTKVLHIFYLAAPMIILSLYALGNRLVCRASGCKFRRLVPEV